MLNNLRFKHERQQIEQMIKDEQEDPPDINDEDHVVKPPDPGSAKEYDMYKIRIHGDADSKGPATFRN